MTKHLLDGHHGTVSESVTRGGGRMRAAVPPGGAEATTVPCSPDLPPTLGSFHWTCIQNPDLSPDCVLLLTPRQPAGWAHRPANISAFWTLRDGERFFLVFGPEDRLRSLAEDALRAP